MKRVLVVFIVLILLPALTSAQEYYVATDGDDGNPGTLEHPFKTLEKARDKIRDLKQAGYFTESIHVILRGGTHYIDETFVLEAQDSGTADKRITYMSYPGEEPIISGGREITSYSPVSDPNILNRLSEDAKANVMQADLEENGVTDFGQIIRRGTGMINVAHLEFFINKEPLKLARWPNQNFLLIKDVPIDPATGEKSVNISHGFYYPKARYSKWSDKNDIWVCGYWNKDWIDSCEKLESVDAATGLIKLHGHLSGATFFSSDKGYRVGNRFFFRNILEELNSPGEYYVDTDSGMLYFWPLQDVTNFKADVTVMGDLLFNFDRTNYVRLEGIVLEGTRASAIEIVGDNNVIENCKIRNVGNDGIYVRGDNNLISGCELYNIGNGAIDMVGGDRITLTPGNNIIRNNVIRNNARWTTTGRYMIYFGGVGGILTQNLLYDSPGEGLRLQGNEHIVEFNVMHDLSTKMSDSGAIHMGADWTQRGNIMRHNLFYNLNKHPQIDDDNKVKAIYLDSCTSGVSIYNNIIYNTHTPIMVNSGRYNFIDNNIIVKSCLSSIYANNFENFDSDHPKAQKLYKNLAKIPYKDPPWSEKYPTLVHILDDNPGKPVGNIITRTVCKDVGENVSGILKSFIRYGSDAENETYYDVYDNLYEEDPLLVDPGSLDFSLHSNSPAFDIGFEEFDTNDIGPQNIDHVVYGDFDGDGIEDTLRIYGNELRWNVESGGSGKSKWFNGWGTGKIVLAANLNGDSFDDIVHVSKSGTNQWRWHTAISDGSGFEMHEDALVREGGSSILDVCDYDADGSDEIIMMKLVKNRCLDYREGTHTFSMEICDINCEIEIADVNVDGEVDISDLILLVSDFGKPSNLNSHRTDTDKNGEVDIFDMVFVGSRFS